MDVSLGYNPLAHAGVGQGFWPQSALGSAGPRVPGTIGLHQPRPSAPCQPAAASGGQEAHPATPYQQAVYPPRQVRFASPITKAEATTNQSQIVAKRGRSQTREQGGRQEQASHSRTRKDRSSTRGPKRRRGITSEDPMEDLMDFVPSRWKRDLMHIVSCFYASQIGPLNTRQWYSDRDKFIQAMEERKSECLNIKELEPLRYMRYLDQCFVDSMGRSLKGLGLLMRWIRPRSYYHWKVAELQQLQYCPHLQGMLVPPGPMECPSMLQQQQRPSRRRATAPSTTRNSGVEGPMTSEGSCESSWMEGGAGDGASWDDLVTRTEASPGASKRKKTDTGQPAPRHPFPLASEGARKEAMGLIHEHAVGLESPRKNIASRAISAYYPDFTLATVEGLASQVLCMIAEYHLACATRGSATMSPILPEAVEQYLPPLVDYAHPGGTSITDVRVCDHKSCSLRVAVWLHRVDMSLSWEKEASESLVLSRHVRGHLLSYLLAPGTGNLRFEEVATQVVQENWETHERAKERFRSSLNSNRCRQAKLLRELNELSQGIEAAVDKKLRKETELRMGMLRTSLRKVETSINESEDHLEESRMREEEAHEVDRGHSNPNTDEDEDVIMEGAQESGPTGAEATGPTIPTTSTQEAERAMDVDIGNMPQLTSEEATTVTPEEDDILTGDPTSVAGEVARLQVIPHESHEPEDGKAS